MRMRLNGLTIRVDLPRPRACQRFIEIDLPTLASWMTRASTSRLWLFSALATALARTLRTSTAIAFFEKARTFIASSTLRSDEHTSELQSIIRISYAVFGLKKKRLL